MNKLVNDMAVCLSLSVSLLIYLPPSLPLNILKIVVSLSPCLPLFLLPLPLPHFICPLLFPSPLSDAREIRQIVMSLQHKKSTSHDSLSPLVIQLLGEQITIHTVCWCVLCTIPKIKYLSIPIHLELTPANCYIAWKQH